MSAPIPFEQAVETHGATVLRVCRAVLGPGPDADDAWSEAFMAALGAWVDLDADTNVEAWLVRVATRKAIDVVRTRARRAIPVAELPDGPSTIGVPGDRGLDVWQAVADLPERQRLAVAYHYLGGLSHVQTAEIVGGTAAAVRRASADGVKTLRRVLAADDPQEGEPR